MSKFREKEENDIVVYDFLIIYDTEMDKVPLKCFKEDTHTHTQWGRERETGQEEREKESTEILMRL